RLLISGAMDAWRYRAAADGAFDRFWQATVAALALAAPPPLEVVVTPPAPGPRERAEVSVRLRSPAPVPVAASVDGIPIRLWPEAEAGVFRGTFTARSAPGRMEMTAMAGGERPYDITYEVLVQDGVAADRGVGPPLALLSAAWRGSALASSARSFASLLTQQPRASRGGRCEPVGGCSLSPRLSARSGGCGGGEGFANQTCSVGR